MTEKQATDRAEILNKTKYKKSRIKVKPVRFGNTWILIGVPNNEKY